MGKSRESAEEISHLIRLHHRGIICPTEMWMCIAKVLTPGTAASVLEDLPRLSKDLLLSVWLERPPAAYIHQSISEPGDEAFQSTCARVVRWCEASGPPADSSPEIDGMIRVRTDAEKVVEWRPWEQS